MANFEQSFKEILNFEGDYSNHPLDTGGATRYGITEAVARLHGYNGEMKNLPLDTAKTIYKKDYWDSLQLDKINDNKICTEIFDIAVNCGQNVAGKILQRTCNYLNRNQQNWKDIAIDGVIGAQTIETCNNIALVDLWAAYKIINGLQFMRYVEIIDKNPTQEIFFRSWLRRV